MSSMDDAFVNAFFSIDRANTKKITKAQLQKFQDSHNYDEKFVEKWLKLFDRNNTGIITLGEFCEVLGLELKEIEEKREKWLEDTKSQEGSGSGLGSAMNHEEMYNDIIEKTKELRAKYPDDSKKVASELKAYIDAKYARAWSVFIVRGQYWAHYSFIPDDNFVFKLGNDNHIVFRSMSD